MIDTINQALAEYFANWKTLANEQNDFNAFLPTAAGWKVADESEYQEAYKALRPLCDRIIETWMNGRWIAKMHLKDSSVEGGVTIIKVMQRRPDSDDALGLDHVDFMTNDVKAVETYLQSQHDVRWSWESNDVIEGYDWISIWFCDTEAKIKPDTVVDIIIKELEEVNESIKTARG